MAATPSQFQGDTAIRLPLSDYKQSTSSHTTGSHTQRRSSTRRGQYGTADLSLCCEQSAVMRATKNRPKRLTSSIVHWFDLDVACRYTSLQCVDLVNSACRGKTQPVLVKHSDHILPMNPIPGLPTGMQSTAKLYMAEGAYATFGCSIEFLRRVRDTLKTSRLPGFHTESGKTRRSCNSQVFSRTAFTRASSVARLTWDVASRSRTRAFSISM